MSLEEFSRARKHKLSLLRSLRVAEQTNSSLGSTSVQASRAIKRHFRNYDPITGQLKRLTSARDLPDTVEKHVDGLERQTIQQDERQRNEQLDLTNIAHKRANWDLKRDLERRLKKLEPADSQATILLIRQRIQSQQTAAGLDANTQDRHENTVTRLTAEIAATATSDFNHTLHTSNDESSDNDD